MLRKNSSFKREGFTILELVMGASIIAIVLCVLLLEFISCAFLSEASRELTRAVTHGQFVMEDIKNTDFSNISSKITAGDWDWNAGDIVGAGLVALTNETIDTSVTGTDLLSVTVRVDWNDRASRARTTSLQTLFAEP